MRPTTEVQSCLTATIDRIACRLQSPLPRIIRECHDHGTDDTLPHGNDAGSAVWMPVSVSQSIPHNPGIPLRKTAALLPSLSWRGILCSPP